VGQNGKVRQHYSAAELKNHHTDNMELFSLNNPLYFTFHIMGRFF
jgi:hypothetical protein